MFVFAKSQIHALTMNLIFNEVEDYPQSTRPIVAHPIIRHIAKVSSHACAMVPHKARQNFAIGDT